MQSVRVSPKEGIYGNSDAKDVQIFVQEGGDIAARPTMTPGKKPDNIERQVELAKTADAAQRVESQTDDLNGPKQLQSGKKSLEQQLKKINNDSESIHDSFEMESNRNAQTPVMQNQSFPNVNRFSEQHKKKKSDTDVLNDTLNLSTHLNKNKDGDLDDKKNINTSMLQKLSNEDDQDYSIASEVLDKDDPDGRSMNDEFPR